MQINFQSLLTSHKFSDSNSRDLKIIGWSYDIEFALFDSASPFDWDRSRINRHWDDPEAYIHTDLVPADGDIAGATQFLLDRWRTELTYDNSMCETVSIQRSPIQSVVRVLTISQSNAMTLKFTVSNGG